MRKKYMKSTFARISAIIAAMMLLPLTAIANDATTNATTARSIDATSHIDAIPWESLVSPLSDVVTTDEGDPTFVYLFSVKNKKFLDSGGCWGTEGMLAYTGMRFSFKKASQTVTSSVSGDQYYIITRMDNTTAILQTKNESAENGTTYTYYVNGTGDCMGYVDDDSQKQGGGIFLDRMKNEGSLTGTFSELKDGVNADVTITHDLAGTCPNSLWVLVEAKTATTTEDGTSTNVYSYKIYNPNKARYVGMDGNTINLVKNEADAMSWYLIKESQVVNVLTNDKLRESYDYIDLSLLIKDGRFERNSKDADSWTIATDQIWFGDECSYIGECEQYGAFVTAHQPTPQGCSSK